MEKGIYTLLLKLSENTKIHVGSLGFIGFQLGHYAYTGSALGSGGLKRVERHLKVASKANLTRRWHLDYFIPETEVNCIILTQTEGDLECLIASEIGRKAESIVGFGSTDCGCRSHLHYYPDLDGLKIIAIRAHQKFGNPTKVSIYDSPKRMNHD